MGEHNLLHVRRQYILRNAYLHCMYSLCGILHSSRLQIPIPLAHPDEHNLLRLMDGIVTGFERAV
jgi:hypothetical protein